MYLGSITDKEFLDPGMRRQVEILAECGKLQKACLTNLVQRALVWRTQELIEQCWGKGMSRVERLE